MKRFVRIKNKILDIEDIQSVEITNCDLYQSIIDGEIIEIPVNASLKIITKQNTFEVFYRENELEYVYELFYNLYAASYDEGNDLDTAIKKMVDKMFYDSPHTNIEYYTDNTNE